MIAVGIVTCNRPLLFERCARGCRKHFSGSKIPFYVYNDGSNPRYDPAYERAYRLVPNRHILGGPNRGVAYAKNMLLAVMLDAGADWLFLLEDDIQITSPDAVHGYVRACEQSGLHHLSFAHHGAANAGGPVETDGPVSYYQHSIGAWSVYSRECLEAVGVFDEVFRNAWEHVEHTMRLAVAGYTSGAWRFADATGSDRWLRELPGALETSVIRQDPGWEQGMVEGREHWRVAHPDTYPLIFA